MDARLPQPLQQALHSELEAHSRIELAQNATRISQNYRRAGGSRASVLGQADALAYATSRMPATFAAAMAAFEQVSLRRREFAPQTALDLGAGCGAATWAMRQAWPTLHQVQLVDENSAFLDLGQSLAQAMQGSALTWLNQDLRRYAPGARRFDLIVANYALTELAEADVAALLARLMPACSGVLVIVEPGTSRDYQRLMRMRAALIGAGGKILAPCPHDKTCPLPADDWCHFSARLARSRDHLLAKGASVPFEDEKFAYLAVELSPGASVLAPSGARVLRKPSVSKHDISLSLCDREGLRTIAIRSRDRPAYATARKLRWGDALAGETSQDENATPAL